MFKQKTKDNFYRRLCLFIYKLFLEVFTNVTTVGLSYLHLPNYVFFYIRSLQFTICCGAKIR